MGPWQIVRSIIVPVWIRFPPLPLALPKQRQAAFVKAMCRNALTKGNVTCERETKGKVSCRTGESGSCSTAGQTLKRFFFFSIYIYLEFQEQLQIFVIALSCEKCSIYAA